MYLWRVFTYYRIHRATESLDTILDPRRPDGWVAGDEGHDTQPHGVSACAGPDLEHLRRYVREYSMAIQPGDRIVAIVGRLGDEDRDDHAVRVIATSCEVVGDARSWYEAGMPDHWDSV